MQIVLILAAGLLLLILGIVWMAGRPRRAAKRLVGTTVERARPVTIGRDRWLVLVEATGKDAGALHAALSGFVLSGDMVGNLVEARLRQVAEDAVGLPDPSSALEESLRNPLAAAGLTLESLRTLGSVSLHDSAMKQLERYVATECYHRDRSAQDKVRLLDLYLDGVSGRGDWTVDCAPRPGAIVQRLTSIELLRNREYMMEVAIDGRSIVDNRSLAEMLAGK